MSQATSPVDLRVERAVRKRSQHADTLHRPDPNSTEPRPACQQAEIDHPGDYREVPPGTHPTYGLCGNPECFGDDHRRGGHIWPGLLTDRPIRIQAYHVAVVAAIEGDTPLTRADVQEVLVVEFGERSVRRGIRDAVDAGWLEWDGSPPAYRQGPLAVALGREPGVGRGGESA